MYILVWEFGTGRQKTLDSFHMVTSQVLGHINDMWSFFFFKSQGPAPGPRGCHASCLMGNKGYVSGGGVSEPLRPPYVDTSVLELLWFEPHSFNLMLHTKTFFFRQWHVSTTILGKPFPVLIFCSCCDSTKPPLFTPLCTKPGEL